jgi:hypothetical protein
MPSCPFCGAAWSEEMLASFDRYSVAGSCGCCSGGAHAGAPTQIPTEDLCCESCGKPIYRAPALEGTQLN